MAVRADVVPELLSRILPAVSSGLADESDEVRAASADALLPIIGIVETCSTTHLGAILATLWDSLLELDDLAASTASVLRLLSSIISLTLVKHNLIHDYNIAGVGLDGLISRLWPFFRHLLSTVRIAAIDALTKLLAAAFASKQRPIWLESVLPAALCHVFQNILVEEHDQVRDVSISLWRAIVACDAPELLQGVSQVHFAKWTEMLVTPSGVHIGPEHITIAAHRPKTDILDDEPAGKRSRMDGIDASPVVYVFGGLSQLSALK